MAKRREEKDVVDVIVGTFVMHALSYFSLIDFGSTHSFIASSVSGNIGILA